MTGWLGLLGSLSVAVMLVVLGVICRRFGQATGAKPYYVGMFAGAALVGVSLSARAVALATEGVAAQGVLWVLLADGLPALGLTVSVAAAWRYWSWLLADRE